MCVCLCVSDLKTFAHKGCKIVAQLPQILPYYQDFFGISATIHIGRDILCLTFEVFVLQSGGASWWRFVTNGAYPV